MTNNPTLASISRGLKAALATLFFWPAVGTASPIVDYQLLAAFRTPVIGWTNNVGNFLVDTRPSSSSFAGVGQQGYSTATSLLAYQGGGSAFNVQGISVNNGLVQTDVQMNVFVQGDGTMSGQLLGGTLIVKAGAQGIAALGAAPGETLVTGYVIDSAAVPSNFSTALLFALTYKIPSLASLGDYLTYGGAHQTFFDGVFGFNPWSIGNGGFDGGGFTFDDFISTRIPEPTTLALVGVGLIGLLNTRRRKASTRAGVGESALARLSASGAQRVS